MTARYQRFPLDDVHFRTPVDGVGVDFPFFVLPNGSEVGTLPLCDRLVEPLPLLGVQPRASLVRADAIMGAALFDCELCTLDDLYWIARLGLWTPFHGLVRDRYDQDHMQSLGYKIQHDTAVWHDLARLHGVTPENVMELGLPVCNMGKTHRALLPGETENGDCYLAGWDKTDNSLPDFIQAGTGPVHRGEARSLHDYGTNTYIRRKRTR